MTRWQAVFLRRPFNYQGQKDVKNEVIFESVKKSPTRYTAEQFDNK